MNPDYLVRMNAQQLDEYGKVLGIDMKDAKTIDNKVELIEKRRNNEATVSVLGLELRVPKKRMTDKRVTDLLEKSMSDVEAEECMTLLLGEDQMAQVVTACTDVDGSVDTIAMGIVFTTVFTCEELKNF